MNWLERMNWPHLSPDEADRIWEEARRLYFDEDTQLQEAFTLALEKEGFEPREFTTCKSCGEMRCEIIDNVAAQLCDPCLKARKD